jgi:hypothetical protein
MAVSDTKHTYICMNNCAYARLLTASRSGMSLSRMLHVPAMDPVIEMQWGDGERDGVTRDDQRRYVI